MLDFDHDTQIKTHEVHLFPLIRISSEGEAEQRATAALLTVVNGVAASGRTIVAAGKLSYYSEVSRPRPEMWLQLPRSVCSLQRRSPSHHFPMTIPNDSRYAREVTDFAATQEL